MKNLHDKSIEKKVDGINFTSKLLSFYTANNLSKSNNSQIYNSNDKTNFPNIVGTLQLNTPENSIYKNSPPYRIKIPKSGETVKIRKIRKGEFNTKSNEQLKPDYFLSNRETGRINSALSPELSPLVRFQPRLHRPFIEEYSILLIIEMNN